jgi:hypothetical protein
MDIHKPKPWHGSREFLKEYLIIVVGVLTALGAEQSVEWLHWRHEVAETREALKQELVSNATRIRFSQIEDRCVFAALDRMDAAALLDDGDNPTRFLRHTSPHLVNFVSSVWEISKSGQAVAHLPTPERLAYARLYDDIGNQMSIVTDQRRFWGQVVRYSTKPRLTPDERRRLAEDVADVRTVHLIWEGNAMRILDEARAVGAQPKARIDVRVAETVCRAIGLPAA